MWLQQMEQATRWTLLKLPNEIITRIVKDCDLQDKLFKERLEQVERLENGNGIIRDWIDVTPSLSALSQTCKVVRTLCCPLLFSVSLPLTGRGCPFLILECCIQYVDIPRARQPTFRRQIASKYSSQIQSIRLDQCGGPPMSDDNLVDFVVLASTFVNLRDLRLHGTVLGQLAGVKADSEPSTIPKWIRGHDEAAVALRVILRRVRSLYVDTIDEYTQLSALLALAGPQLDSLALDCSPFGEVVEADEAEFSAQLYGLTGLLHLDLSFGSFDYLSRPTEPSWPLESISFMTENYVTQDAINYISLFASTLTSLTIITEEDEENENDPDLSFTCTFPLLSHLRTDGTTKLLLHTAPDRFPALQHLSINTMEQAVPPLAQHLGSLIGRHDRLRSLHLAGRFEYISYLPHTLSKTIEIAAASLPHVDNRLKFDPFLLSKDEQECHLTAIGEPKESPATFIERRRSHVRRVLDFALNHEERIARTDDMKGMQRLVEGLRSLSMLKDFEED